MIDVYHASSALLEKYTAATNERDKIALVTTHLADYQKVTSVKHSELDIAFAATGGPSPWVNVDNMSITFDPVPKRRSDYGDILVERGLGYVNLSTPAGFIPLVDVIERFGTLCHKQLS